MTRREEIERAWFSRAVQSNHRYDEKSFKEAVEWADKTMIEKACKWITEHIDIPYEGEFIDDIPVDYVEYLSKRLEYAKAVANAFKQAMEE